MEEELAAIEEDVERKRVAKNPFEERFTSLTETPFAETVGSGQEEMETLSRQIIVRMEVIAKQIAFLCKETSGQPGNILTGSAAAPLGSLASAAAHDQHRSGGSSTNGYGEHSRLGAVHGEGDVVGGGSPLGAPLSARFDLYRRLCQGLVTAEELLPADIMSLSSALQLLLATSTSGDGDYPRHTMTSTTAADDRPVPPSRQGSEEKGSCSEPIVRDTRAPPGVLHDFIKHVRPFSLCLDPSGPSSRVEKTPSPTTRARENQADAAGTSAIGGGGESSPCQEDRGLPIFGGHAQDGERGGDMVTGGGRERGGGMVTGGGGGGGGGAVDDHGGVPGRAHNPATALTLPAAGSRLETSGTQQEVHSDRDDAGAPRKPATHETSSLSARRAKMRLHGKRKLPPAAATAASTSVDPGATTIAHPTTSNRKKLTTAAGKGARREAKGVKSGGSSGLNAGGNVDWSSLTWKSARTLRKRMEHVKTSDGRSSTGTPNKKGAPRGGGRKGGQISLSGTVPGRASAIGALGLIRANACLDFPKIDRVEDYLISLANPVRDVTAMKRLFRQQARPPPAHTRDYMESPGGSPSECGGSPESFNLDAIPMLDDIPMLDSIPVERGGDEAHSLPKKGGRRGAPAQDSEADRSHMPPTLGTPTRDAKPGGTCTIDLRNNWQRAGAISTVISQAVEKRNSVASDLRESFSRLNLQHRQRELEHRMAPCDRTDEGREKPNATEASMSVSLRYPPASPSNDTQLPLTLLGGVEEKARMFALVMSLAHVHNTCAPTAAPAGGRGGDENETSVGQAPSQLRVDLSSGGDEAIVVAVSKN